MIPKRNADTDEVYQGDIYSKGSYLMHTLRYMMGDEVFFKAIKAYASMMLTHTKTSHLLINLFLFSVLIPQ